MAATVAVSASRRQPALAPNGQPLATFLDRFLRLPARQPGRWADHRCSGRSSLIVWWFAESSAVVVRWRARHDRARRTPSTRSRWCSSALYIRCSCSSRAPSCSACSLPTSTGWSIQLRQDGQTVGKRVMKTAGHPGRPRRVADTAAISRNAGWWRALPARSFRCFSLLDGLWQLWDKPLQQCLHDKAAQTVVVKVG